MRHVWTDISPYNVELETNSFELVAYVTMFYGGRSWAIWGGLRLEQPVVT